MLQIGDIDRAIVYVSLALGMEHPPRVDPPMDNAARCFQCTSSDEDDNRLASTTNDRVAGKRLMAQEPSRAGAVPGDPQSAMAQPWEPRR